MNAKREKEIQKDVAFLRQRFDEMNQNVTLPQNLQGEQLLHRLNHTKAQPKPAVRPAYWRMAPVACAFVFIVGIAAYMKPWNFGAKSVTANDSAALAESYNMAAPQAAPTAEAAPETKEEEMLESQCLDDIPAGESRSADEPFNFIIVENDTPADYEPTPKSEENGSGFANYTEIEKELGQIQSKKKEGVYFGGGENEPDLYTRGEVVNCTTNSFYVGVDPATNQYSDILYITGEDELTVEKEIALPSKSTAEVFLGVEEKDIFVIAAQNSSASIMTMDLSTYQGNSYVQSGEYNQCFTDGEALFVVTTMKVSEDDLKNQEYIPYTVENGVKQLLDAKNIYSTQGDAPYYTIVSRMPLRGSAQTMNTVAMLGSKAKVALRQQTLTILAEDSEEAVLTFSSSDLRPIS